MIDLRRIRVSIELDDEVKIYEGSGNGFYIHAKGTKYANPLQNSCEVTIIGMKKETRDFLLSETSPFNANKKTKRIVLEVGRQSTDLFQLFVGDITDCKMGNAPDLAITIKAKTNNANNVKVVSFSGGDLISTKDIAQKVATDSKLKLDYQAEPKQVSSYSYSGSLAGMMRSLSDATGSSVFIDDETLFIKDKEEPLKNKKRILNMNSGMVGMPSYTKQGLQVTYLITGESELGGQLEVQSKFNETLNGNYIIDQLQYEVSTHDTPFFYTALCRRMKE